MDLINAKKIINNAVKTSEPLWGQYGVYWKDIDGIFIMRGYEQARFESWVFAKNLEENGIFSIEKLGLILDDYSGKKGYDRGFAGSLESSFYNGLLNGLYGDEGKNFYKSVKEFEGLPGAYFWRLLWWMLVCCNYLKNNYNGSFSYYLKKKFAEYTNKSNVSDPDLFNMSSETWEDFKIAKKPWNELYGIGENVFDFVIGDIEEFNFNQNSYKLDAANKNFLIKTGIFKAHELNRENAITFIQSLELPYTLREINKGIYAYSSDTESWKYGFCHNPKKCEECKVNDICEKNF